MKVVFAGTPGFARVALQRLLDAGFSLPLVLTRPDQPAGRGLQWQASPVKQCALAHGLAVAQPRSLRLDGRYPQDAAAARAALLAAQAEVMVVAAYGLILPQWVLDLPARGCLNIHASLLPRWRGAAPIQRAIEAGDTHTGVTIMQMDAGLDTGAMLLSQGSAIAPTDTTATLHDRLAALGADLIVQALEKMAAGADLPALAQPAQGVAYARKIEKSESSIDWSLPAQRIGQRIRAFDPAPGASTTCNGTSIKLWGYAIDGATIDGQRGASRMHPGQILSADDSGIAVACGQGTALRLTVLQRAGGKRLAAADFLRGFALQPGMWLGAARA
ncbi:methionyl-tRNA formyltransferase [Verminephrobacter eiseniae]|uniref:methionyl-tRNA formyltransferase n=1 Tax=Verminephrobacter eiseniae TaxID=364317 RepID=UPI002238C2C0|nr:methionyl-tRNA formyltransferase [Verminephrobacter eiseniae]MCW5231866.1 methionyl-tRNA formyltransferase [Verminephrobacter eiseniae]MCW5293600.1 methionyl-tRNA formyltransferase [Verminephrobacter eiseniae]MCW8184256.1 methionyl-tRNA formyltransferase [Verminephrobacter eiseniae]MCW8224059.1 methionyl-tRNA formyltransferase [Verminephrobacter eiseniae]MCW8233271.1 methionyl-tRNA formyltransferase [Verminephrobacter eiseniae]